MDLVEVAQDVCHNILISPRQINRLINAAQGNPKKVQDAVRMMVQYKMRASGADWSQIDQVLDTNESVATDLAGICDAVWDAMGI